MQLIDDVPVVYGLGNFLSNQSSNCCAAGSQDGMIMQVHIHERSNGGFETSLTYVPTRVDRSDFMIVPVADALAKPNLSSLGEGELEASNARTEEIVYRLGADTLVGQAGPFGAAGSIGELISPARGEEAGDPAD